MISIHIKSTFIILLALSISACGSATLQQQPSDLPNIKAKIINHDKIAKKLLIVMPSGDYDFMDYSFLGTDPALRSMLENEAELATIIAYDLAITSNAANVDLLALQTLAYAGYDPQAAINLQNRIINARNADENWQLGSFNQYNLNQEVVANNKKIAVALPRGLSMGAKL